MFQVMVAEHALVDGFNIVDEGEIEVGREGVELVEVKAAESRPCRQRKVAWVLMMMCL